MHCWPDISIIIFIHFPSPRFVRTLDLEGLSSAILTHLWVLLASFALNLCLLVYLSVYWDLYGTTCAREIEKSFNEWGLSSGNSHKADFWSAKFWPILQQQNCNICYIPFFWLSVFENIWEKPYDMAFSMNIEYPRNTFECFLLFWPYVTWKECKGVYYTLSRSEFGSQQPHHCNLRD